MEPVTDEVFQFYSTYNKWTEPIFSDIHCLEIDPEDYDGAFELIINHNMSVS